MRRTYLELFFRHRLLFTLPVLLAFALGATWGLSKPRSYIVTATFWTDSPIPSESTVAGRVTGTPPANGQQSLLSELLATRSFLLAVANDSPLAVKIKDQTPEQVSLVLGSMASGITVTVSGPQVFAVSVKDTSQVRAVGVASSLVKQYLAAHGDRIRNRANAQLEYDQKQLSSASQQLQKAQAGLQQYTQRHRSASPTDSTLAQLTAIAAAAQQQQSDASQAVSRDQAALEHATDASVLDVIDKPNHAYRQSRLKTLLLGGVGGLLAGASISILTLLVLMARDTSVRDLAELEGLTVVGTLGQLPRRRKGREARGLVTGASGGEPTTTAKSVTPATAGSGASP